MAVVGGVLVLAMAVACLRHYAQQVANGKLGLGPEGGAETHFDYQVRPIKRPKTDGDILYNYILNNLNQSISQPINNIKSALYMHVHTVC